MTVGRVNRLYAATRYSCRTRASLLKTNRGLVFDRTRDRLVRALGRFFDSHRCLSEKGRIAGSPAQHHCGNDVSFPVCVEAQCETLEAPTARAREMYTMGGGQALGCRPVPLLAALRCRLGCAYPRDARSWP